MQMNLVNKSPKKLKFAGDVWLPRNKPYSIPYGLAEGLIFNMECPITKSNNEANGKICLKSDAEAFDKTFNSYPLAVSLANNHILDYGSTGLIDTINFLKERDISYFGAGLKSQNYNNPLFLNWQEKLISISGYVCKSTHPVSKDGEYGVSLIEIEKIKSDIDFAKAKGACYCVVILHWGDEEVEIPKQDDLLMARQLIDHGVDLIVGHHAHCMQPVMHYKDKIVAFGLGNMIFPSFEYIDKNNKVSWNKQRGWNNKSIVVELNYELTVGFCALLQKSENRLKFVKKNIKFWFDDKPNFSKYSNYYEKMKKYFYLRYSISRIIHKPDMKKILKAPGYLINAITRGFS